MEGRYRYFRDGHWTQYGKSRQYVATNRPHKHNSTHIFFKYSFYIILTLL